jgi:cell division protein FtsQ
VWDNPRLLNLAANALIGFALAVFAYAGLQQLLRSPLFPLREVVVRGELTRASREEIVNALDGIGGNFFSADLGLVRGRLEQAGWVRRVDARRVWPDRIEVRLEEHVAFARWSQVEAGHQPGGLVNSYGEPFSAVLEADLQARLPLFAGPAGTEGELTRRYRSFTQLLAPLGAAPERVELTPRHAWRLRMASGLELELGRDGAEPVEARLARFVAAYPDSIGRLLHSAGSAHEGAPGAPGAPSRRHVDLRYPNGFALRVAGWKG